MADSRMVELEIDLSMRARGLGTRADKRTQAPDCGMEAVRFCAADRDGVWSFTSLRASEKSGNITDSQSLFDPFVVEISWV
jgi:hypothetical protein